MQDLIENKPVEMQKTIQIGETVEVSIKYSFYLFFLFNENNFGYFYLLLINIT